MKKIFVLMLLLLAVFCLLPSFVIGSPSFPHIKTAIGLLADVSNQEFLGSHYDLRIGGGVNVVTGVAQDLTTLFNTNPNILLFPYITGSTQYRYDLNVQTPHFMDYYNAWAIANAVDVENGFYHFVADHDYTSLPPPYVTCELVEGFQLGRVPGYPSGTATNITQARVPGTNVYLSACLTSVKSISGTSGAVRTTDPTDNVTITIVAGEEHHLITGDWIEISGVADSSFNGVFVITQTPSTTTFKYTQAGDAATSQNGTVTHHRARSYTYNFKALANWANFFADYMPAVMLHDNAGHKASGYFYDTPQDQVFWGWDIIHLENTKEWQEDTYWTPMPTNPSKAQVIEWVTHYSNIWSSTVRAGVSSYLGKPALICINGNNLSNVGDLTLWPFYAGDGIDIMIIENGNSFIAPATVIVASQSMTHLKNAYDLTSAPYNKQIIYQYSSYHTHILETYTLYSGNIYYRDISSLTPMTGVVVGGVSLSRKYSLGVMTAGSYFWDSTNQRLYIWKSNGTDPSSDAISFYGREPQQMWKLSMYYAFANNNSYFASLDGSGLSYSIQPDSEKAWYPAIEYDVGSPVNGGVDVNGNITTNLWGTSTSSDNRPYIMWQDGNHRLYGRKYQNAVMVVRPRAEMTDSVSSDPRTFTMPFPFRKLRGDKSLDITTTQLTIAQGEGAILIIAEILPESGNLGIGSTDGGSQIEIR